LVSGPQRRSPNKIVITIKLLAGIVPIVMIPRLAGARAVVDPFITGVKKTTKHQNGACTKKKRTILGALLTYKSIKYQVNRMNYYYSPTTASALTPTAFSATFSITFSITFCAGRSSNASNRRINCSTIFCLSAPLLALLFCTTFCSA